LFVSGHRFLACGRARDRGTAAAGYICSIFDIFRAHVDKTIHAEPVYFWSSASASPRTLGLTLW